MRINLPVSFGEDEGTIASVRIVEIAEAINELDPLDRWQCILGLVDDIDIPIEHPDEIKAILIAAITEIQSLFTPKLPA